MRRADKSSARVDEMGWGRVQHGWMSGVQWECSKDEVMELRRSGVEVNAARMN
jgi:hypothetical protein